MSRGHCCRCFVEVVGIVHLSKSLRRAPSTPHSPSNPYSPLQRNAVAETKDRSLNLQMTPGKNENVFANAHSESVKIFFLSFRWIPKSIVVTKENVAEAIYLLEYKFLCSLSREPRWLLIIYFLCVSSGKIHLGEWFSFGTISLAKQEPEKTVEAGKWTVNFRTYPCLLKWPSCSSVCHPRWLQSDPKRCPRLARLHYQNLQVNSNLLPTCIKPNLSQFIAVINWSFSWLGNIFKLLSFDAYSQQPKWASVDVD